MIKSTNRLPTLNYKQNRFRSYRSCALWDTDAYAIKVEEKNTLYILFAPHLIEVGAIGPYDTIRCRII